MIFSKNFFGQVDQSLTELIRDGQILTFFANKLDFKHIKRSIEAVDMSMLAGGTPKLELRISRCDQA